jgi:hypothetical protein
MEPIDEHQDENHNWGHLDDHPDDHRNPDPIFIECITGIGSIHSKLIQNEFKTGLEAANEILHWHDRCASDECAMTVANFRQIHLVMEAAFLAIDVAFPNWQTAQDE